MQGAIAMFSRSASCICFVLLAFLAANTNCPSRAAEPELPKAHFLLAWGAEGDEPGEFEFPIGIAVNRSDKILVADHYNHRVQKFDRAGKFLSQFKVLPNPGGIALDTAGNIYVSHFQASKRSDITPHRVSVYSPEGKQLHAWGKTGTGPGEFNYPGGLAVAPNGHIYVADQTNHRVQVLGPGGTFLTTWGKYGSKPGEFGGNTNNMSRTGGPDFLALDRQGNIYATGGMDGRVQKFTADGKFLLAFGENEDRPGSFGRDFESLGTMHGPIGICIDAQDRLWISAAGGRIQQFTADGRYLRGFGEKQGEGEGEFLAPHGLAIDSHGDLYVVDSYNHRVQKFDVTGK